MNSLSPLTQGSLQRKSIGHEVGNLGFKVAAGAAIYFISFEALLVYLALQAVLIFRNTRA